MTKATAITLAVVVAAVAMMLFAAPASAFGRGGSDEETKVSNTNTATVSNTMTVKANTGKNDTNGGDGEEGGNGGDVEGVNKWGQGGNGGNGGNGGHGGLILTGDATAYGTISNDVNYNKTKIQGCGCDEESESPWARFFNFGGKNGGDKETKVKNENTATVSNSMDVKANTGKNVSDGGDGEEGGNGGDVEGDKQGGYKNDAFSRFFSWMNKGGTSSGQGGDGGAGGNGGHGGIVTTGEAYSDGLIMNVVNRNVTRITR